MNAVHNWMPVAVSITDLGDVAVTVSLAALVLMWLIFCGGRNAAVAWAVGFSAVGAAIAAQKVGARACDLTWPKFGIVSVSGHMAMSTVVYGICAMLIGGRSSRLIRPLSLLVAGLVVTGIGWSRVVLHAHSVGEVLAGLVLGLTGLGLIVFFGRPAERGVIGRGALALASALLLVVLYGRSVDAEAAVAHFANEFRSNFGVCGGTKKTGM